ncbi:MAG: alpha/beta fold hydrolase [Hyphomonadaceae bacterium]
MENNPNISPGKLELTDEGIIHIPGMASRWVRLEDGRRAHYMTTGDKGPAVLLLHGGIEGSSGTAGWRFMAPYLGANGFRVYCPDQPGFGLADTSKKEYVDTSYKAKNDFIKMFVDALCLDKFHMAGNSMGCITSCNFVVSNPERVLSVMFIAGFLGNIAPGSPNAPKMGKFKPDRKVPPMPEAVMWDGTEDGMRVMMDGIIYEQQAVWPELIKMRTMAGLNQRAARDRFGLVPVVKEITDVMGGANPSMVQIFHTKDRLDKLTIPMIYMYGMQDVILPVEMGYDQEDAVPNIQFFYPTETGHQGQTDRPKTFNQVALEFFRDGKISWETAVEAGVSLRRPINAKLVEEPKGGFPKINRDMYADPASHTAGLKAADLL